MVEISRKWLKWHQHAFRGHNFLFDCGFSISLVLWKLYIYRFPRTPRSAQSDFGKAFKYASKAKPGKCQNCWYRQGGRRPFKVCRKPKGHFSSINDPWPLILQPKKKKKKSKGSFSKVHWKLKGHFFSINDFLGSFRLIISLFSF